ncbi:hypothetical protein IQ235_09360 [Oscillatoriales cyanobacterium LEGE 11467]|uniref:Uncharacterized protein n=1 Tax=Zarconia navalis LEGE 11467 TaxID=1828826 RepID=A0A928Z719_9CYAN|nr:hypothetical protein [Zarconia navalis]MBE9040987.1 hypothetical protein [Zarconia navalis LEGE 11467]
MITLTDRKKIVKVDRVNSVYEASQLDELCVDIISISISDSIQFSDRRKVLEKEAIEIQKNLKNAKLCGQISVRDCNTQSCLNFIQNCGLTYVQLPFPEIPPIDFRRTLQELGVGLIYAGIEASYDDDPSWILSRFQDVEALNTEYFQIEILPVVQNSWSFFKNECPKYPEELQIEDINQIATINPVIISVDFNSDNILEIVKKLNNVRGIGLTLGTLASKQYLPHTLEFPQAIELLKTLRSSVGEVIV